METNHQKDSIAFDIYTLADGAIERAASLDLIRIVNKVSNRNLQLKKEVVALTRIIRRALREDDSLSDDFNEDFSEDFPDIMEGLESRMKNTILVLSKKLNSAFDDPGLVEHNQDIVTSCYKELIKAFEVLSNLIIKFRWKILELIADRDDNYIKEAASVSELKKQLEN